MGLATLAAVALVIIWARAAGGTDSQATPHGLWASAYGIDVAFELGVDGLALLTGLVVLTTVAVTFAGAQRANGLTIRLSAVGLLITGAFLAFALAQNLLTIYLSWEVLGLLQILIWRWTSEEPLAQPPWLLIIGHGLGSAFLLAVLMTDLTASPYSLPPLAGLLILAALTPRLLLFPLHAWTLAAWRRPLDPFRVMVVLISITSGMLLLLRMLQYLDVSGLFWVWNGLLVMGALTALAGGVAALRSRSLPESVGAALIAQIGIVAMAISVGGVFAWGVALFALLSGALGMLITMLGHAQAEDGHQGLPSAGLIVAGGLTLAGVPALPGFVVQWMVYDVFLLNQRWDLAILSLLVMVVAATRIFAAISLPRPSLVSWHWGSAEISGALVALVILALGLYPIWALQWIVAPAVPGLDWLSPLSFATTGAGPIAMTHWPVALALAALGPLSALGVIWWLGRVSGQQLRAPSLPQWADQPLRLGRLGMADWALWATAVEERHYLPAIGLFGLGMLVALAGLAAGG